MEPARTKADVASRDTEHPDPRIAVLLRKSLAALAELRRENEARSAPTPTQAATPDALADARKRRR